MTKNFFMMLGGGLLLGLSACGGGTEGYCDPAEADDPDCLLDGACAATSCLDAGTCTMEQTAACWEAGDATAEACLVGEIQLDPGDPDCEECDFDESIDGCIVCPDPTDTTDDTCCDLANAPGWCDPFVPANWFVNGLFAYDPANDAARGYNFATMDGSVEQPAWMQFVLMDERYQSTQNPAYACSVAGITPEGSTVPFTTGDMYTVSTQDSNGNFSDVDYDWFAVEFRTGGFAAQEYNYSLGGNQVPWCDDAESIYLDPATWPDGVGPVFESQSWSFYLGTPSPIIDSVNPQVFGDELYEGGLAGGGAMSRAGFENDGALLYMPYYYGFGQALDEDFRFVEDEEGDAVYIPASDFTPSESTVEPARGVYTVATPYLFDGPTAWLGLD